MTYMKLVQLTPYPSALIPYPLPCRKTLPQIRKLCIDCTVTLLIAPPPPPPATSQCLPALRYPAMPPRPLPHEKQFVKRKNSYPQTIDVEVIDNAVNLTAIFLGRSRARAKQATPPPPSVLPHLLAPPLTLPSPPNPILHPRIPYRHPPDKPSIKREKK